MSSKSHFVIRESTHLVILMHADPSMGARYVAAQAAVGVVADVVCVVSDVGPATGLSSRYTALAAACRQLGKGDMLRGLATRYRPPRALGEYEHVVLACYSAGYAFARELDAASIAQLSALVLIDSGHGAEGLPASQTDWLRTWATHARASRKVMVIGHTDVDPVSYASTTEVAEAAIRLSGEPLHDWEIGAAWGDDPGLRRRRREGLLVVESYDRHASRDAKREHGDALTVWGDELVAQAACLCAGLGSVIESAGGYDLADALSDAPQNPDRSPLGARIVRWLEAEMDRGAPREKPGPAHETRIVAYGKHTRRGGLFAGLDEIRQPVWRADRNSKRGACVADGTDEQAWCAHLRSAALEAALEPGEEPPHGLRSAVWELVEDAGGSLRVPFRGTGCFVPAGAAVIPEPGWAAIYKRAGGDPRVRGSGHVRTVVTTDAARRTYLGIGGNERNTMVREEHPIDAPDLVGWIRTG